MRNGNLLERKTWGTYIMNGTRLAKKNDLAMKVMVAFAIAKIVVLIINHKTQEGFVPLLVLFALFAVGNVVFQLINDRSELMKFTSVTALICTISYMDRDSAFSSYFHIWNSDGL